MIHSEEVDKKTPQPPVRRGKTNLIWAIAITILAAVAFVLFTRTQTASAPDSTIVAVVNDEQITRDELDSYIAQLTEATQQQHSEEEGETSALEQGALKQIIASRLLLQDAKQRGVAVSEDDVDAQYDAIASQASGQGASFEELLAEEGISADAFRQSLRDQLILEPYFALLFQEHNIFVTEDELQQAFDELGGQEGTGVSFEEAKQQLREQLEQKKLEELLPSIIAQLTEQAEIEVYI